MNMDTRYSKVLYSGAISLKPLDLVQEMEWEDHVEFISLVEAGLEEDSEAEPLFGQYLSNAGSIFSYTDWFYEDDESFSVI